MTWQHLSQENQAVGQDLSPQPCEPLHHDIQPVFLYPLPAVVRNSPDSYWWTEALSSGLVNENEKSFEVHSQVSD
jgi:hypothetical protein